MTRAVLDPNVLIAAVLTPDGVGADCLRAHAEGRFELVVSLTVLDELAAVLGRAKFRKYLTPEQAERYVASLRREGRVLADPGNAERVSPDPKDDYLVALARSAGAHVLVSGDPRLTGLRLPDPPIVTPREFLARLP